MLQPSSNVEAVARVHEEAPVGTEQRTRALAHIVLRGDERHDDDAPLPHEQPCDLRGTAQVLASIAGLEAKILREAAAHALAIEDDGIVTEVPQRALEGKRSLGLAGVRRAMQEHAARPLRPSGIALGR